MGPCTGPGTHLDPDAATDSDKQDLKKLAADAGNAFSILNPCKVGGFALYGHNLLKEDLPPGARRFDVVSYAGDLGQHVRSTRRLSLPAGRRSGSMSGDLLIPSTCRGCWGDGL